MLKIMLFLLLASSSVHANFVNTSMPFDMVVIGENCYFKLFNDKYDFKYKKSISMIANDKGVPQDIDGFFIPGYEITEDISSIDVRENGDVFIFRPSYEESQLYYKIKTYQNGQEATSEQCSIKQGVIYNS